MVKSLFLFFILSTSLLFSQKYSYPKMVTSSNGRPINNATLALFNAGTETKAYDLTYDTNSAGQYYTNSLIANGNYDLKMKISGSWKAVAGHQGQFLSFDDEDVSDIRNIVKGDSVSSYNIYSSDYSTFALFSAEFDFNFTKAVMNDTLEILGRDTIPSDIFLDMTNYNGFFKGDGGDNDTLVILCKVRNEPRKWIESNLVVKFDSLGKSNELYFENWGAKGDAATDDSTAFYRAIDQSNGILIKGVQGKTYRINNSSSLQIADRAINIGSTGGNFTVKPDSQLFDFQADGTISTTTLVGDYTPGTDTLIVASSADITVGDLIAIRSDELWDFGSAVKQELIKVKRKSETAGNDTVFIQPALVDEYTSETVTVRIYNTKKLQLSNFTIEYPSDTKEKGIEAYYFSPVEVENVIFKNSATTGIEFIDCMGGYISYCKGEYIDETGNGYMAYMNGSTDIDVGPGNESYSGRGGLVDGGGRVSRRIHVFRNKVFNLQSSSDRTAGNHQACEHWVWESNIFADCNIGLLIRGEQNYVLNNTFFNVTTPISINGGGTVYVKNNNVFSNHSWRGGIGADYSDNLASNIVTITSNADQTRDSKYIIENNYGEVKQCIVEASIGDTLYNLNVKNNTIYGDYSKNDNGFFEVLGTSGTHLIDSDIRLNTIIAPDTLKDFVKTFNTAVTYDTSKINLDNLFKKDVIFFEDSRIKFKKITQYWDTTNSVYRWDTASGDSTLTQSFSDSLQTALSNNSDFETNIANWGSKVGTNSYETTAPLVGTGSIKMVSDTDQSGSIIDTAQALTPGTVYKLAGVLKLTAGTTNKDIRVSMFKKQTGNNFIGQLPIASLGTATLNTKVTFSGEFSTPNDPTYTHYGIQVDDLNTTFIADSINIQKRHFYGLETKVYGSTTLDSVSFSGGGQHISKVDTTATLDSLKITIGGAVFVVPARRE